MDYYEEINAKVCVSLRAMNVFLHDGNFPWLKSLGQRDEAF
jgi:hypothetical protein